MGHSLFSLRSVLGLTAATLFSVPLLGQSFYSTENARERMHHSDQWAAIEQHLPDPATATVADLERQADILRVRRFPEDAMDYYKYALARGGNGSALLNKLGLTELEMRNTQLARAYFQRAVKMNKKDAQAWNNLGAVEYLNGTSASAVSDYKKAVKLDRHQAVFHANLSTAYFEQKDYSGARREIAAALKIDPLVFERTAGSGGVAAHVLSSEDRARFSFEMAKLYAREGLEEQMLHSLATASEAGMDVQHEMQKDTDLAKFEMDPRVVVLVHNAEALRMSRAASASTSSAVVPALPGTKPAGE
jgi:tetratricopeptide (TPR) repeat protein